MNRQPPRFHSRFFSVVTGCLGVVTLVGASHAQQDAVLQRLVPRPAPVAAWNAEAPTDCPLEKSKQFGGIVFTGFYAIYTVSDTWYPSWASDGNLYSPWTDGHIGKMVSGSGKYLWTTGQAKIVGDDPMRLEVTALGLHKGLAEPYGGRYPCGSLVLDGTWYYGTYCLDWKEDPWDTMGPFVGFRTSRDFGQTWTETPCTPSKPLFGESCKDGAKVKIGAPHFIDFGQNMQHSPDGKAYLTAHGATRPEATCSWVSGDQVYLARVTPTVENINDPTKYEFFAGHDADGEPLWTGNFAGIKPLIEWNDRSGCVTMTYNPTLKKYFMCVTDGGETGRGAYDTWIVESDRITGPWRMVAFMDEFGDQAYFVNIPSKFISPDGRTAWLCYANGWAKRDNSHPAGGRYGMCLFEFKLLGPGEALPKSPPDPLKANTNVALKAKVTASTIHINYRAEGAIDGVVGGFIDGVVGGYPSNGGLEWSSQEENAGAWLKLEWDSPQTVDRVLLFDRPNTYDYITTGKLTFSDGSSIDTGELPDEASAGREVTFPKRTVTWVKFEVTGVKTGFGNIGLAEMSVFAAGP